MPPKRKTRQSKSATEEEISPHKPFDIPYFAHQRLDPGLFPDNVGLPVGGPPTQSAVTPAAKDVNGWNDDGSDNSARGDEGSDDDYAPKKVSKSRKRNAIVPLDGATYKRMKVTGGRPAMAKKVTADMDSDDELIFSMKNAKYLEKDIAKRLADEGRMNYNPKTIGTRWARLKRAMQKKQDDLLDQDLTDWHDGDDEVLYQAVEKAEIAVAEAIDRAKERKWRIVAKAVKDMKNACEKRFNDLRDGTAKPTPESETNPSPTTLARIEARRERQQKIEDDQKKIVPNTGNIEGNAWTSRQREYFG